jgi:hypothetical protein
VARINGKQWQEYPEPSHAIRAWPLGRLSGTRQVCYSVCGKAQHLCRKPVIRQIAEKTLASGSEPSHSALALLLPAELRDEADLGRKN